MNLNYESEKYGFWISIDSVSFSRKLVYETAFDGLVKIYSLKSDSPDLNLKLGDKFFGDFMQPTRSGVFLRMFENKTSWPKTTLVYIDFNTYSFTEVKSTKSSWLVWRGSDLGHGKYQIEISPKEIIDYQIPTVK